MVSWIGHIPGYYGGRILSERQGLGSMTAPRSIANTGMTTARRSGGLSYQGYTDCRLTE